MNPPTQAAIDYCNTADERRQKRARSIAKWPYAESDALYLRLFKRAHSCNWDTLHRINAMLMTIRQADKINLMERK